MYLSVIQFRRESYKYEENIYASRYELILGDMFGTIESSLFIKFPNLFGRIFTLINTEISTYSALNRSKNYSSFKVLTSLLHVNILSTENQRETIFNLVMSPLNYGVCNFHELGILPDFNLNLYVCLDKGSNTNKKYTNFIDFGSLSVKYGIYRRVKELKNEKEKIAHLKACDNQSRMLDFLWNYELTPNELDSFIGCLCTSDKALFDLKGSKILYDFADDNYLKPCIYSNQEDGFLYFII